MLIVLLFTAVPKAFATLSIELHVPLAYRDYLRRYFNAIKPEEAPADSSDPSAAP